MFRAGSLLSPLAMTYYDHLGREVTRCISVEPAEEKPPPGQALQAACAICHVTPKRGPSTRSRAWLREMRLPIDLRNLRYCLTHPEM